MTPSPWTADLDAQLTRRWSDADRPSCAQIGRDLGLTKNQIIGRAHRIGLPKRESPVHTARRKRPLRFCHDGHLGNRVGPITDCKFIAGDPHGAAARGENPFCGEPSLPGSCYCADHHAVCYTRAAEFAA